MEAAARRSMGLLEELCAPVTLLRGPPVTLPLGTDFPPVRLARGPGPPVTLALGPPVVLPRRSSMPLVRELAMLFSGGGLFGSPLLVR